MNVCLEEHSIHVPLILNKSQYAHANTLKMDISPFVHNQYWYLWQTRPGQQISLYFLLPFALHDLAALLCLAQVKEGAMEVLGEGIEIETASDG